MYPWINWIFVIQWICGKKCSKSHKDLAVIWNIWGFLPIVLMHINSLALRVSLLFHVYGACTLQGILLDYIKCNCATYVTVDCSLYIFMLARRTNIIVICDTQLIMGCILKLCLFFVSPFPILIVISFLGRYSGVH